MPVSGSPKPAIILRCPQCSERVVLEDRRRLDLNELVCCASCGREGKVVDFVIGRPREPDEHGGGHSKH
jgi:hypothetical protein